MLSETYGLRLEFLVDKMKIVTITHRVGSLDIEGTDGAKNTIHF